MDRQTKNREPELSPAPPKKKGGYPPIVNTGLLREFEKHLITGGKAPITVRNAIRNIRRFLRFIGGEKELSGIGDKTVEEFFKQIPESSKRQLAVNVGQFLRFALAPRNLPAPVQPESHQGARERIAAPLRPAGKEGALTTMQQGWAIDRLKQQKESGDDIIAKLGRKLIDHYLYFESRLRGEPESMEELARMAAECRELLHTHLEILRSLSANGRNVHTLIDERVNHESRRMASKIRGVPDS